jgi:hypothetical protein
MDSNPVSERRYPGRQSEGDGRGEMPLRRETEAGVEWLQTARKLEVEPIKPGVESSVAIDQMHRKRLEQLDWRVVRRVGLGRTNCKQIPQPPREPTVCG